MSWGSQTYRNERYKIKKRQKLIKAATDKPFYRVSGTGYELVTPDETIKLTPDEYLWLIDQERTSYAGNPPSFFDGWVTTTHRPEDDVVHRDWDRTAFLASGATR